jgi:transcriptional antiterminator
MTFDNLPQDPIILLSFINTKLRDEYSSLQDLCDDLNVDQLTIKAKLSQVGYVYDAELNKFV